MNSLPFPHVETPAGCRFSPPYQLQSMLLDRCFRPQGLGRGHVAVLARVLEKTGLARNKLSALQGMDRAATTRTLQTLEQAGLVRRWVNPDNRRAKLVAPTDKTRYLSQRFLPPRAPTTKLFFKVFP